MNSVRMRIRQRNRKRFRESFRSDLMKWYLTTREVLIQTGKNNDYQKVGVGLSLAKGLK